MLFEIYGGWEVEGALFNKRTGGIVYSAEQAAFPSM